MLTDTAIHSLSQYCPAGLDVGLGVTLRGVGATLDVVGGLGLGLGVTPRGVGLTFKGVGSLGVDVETRLLEGIGVFNGAGWLLHEDANTIPMRKIMKMLASFGNVMFLQI